MPKFRNVITGLAISTALAGGSLALAATTATTAAAATTTVASATNGCGWGWGHGCRGRNCNRNKLRNHNTNLNYWRPTHVHKRRVHKSNRAATIFAGPDAVVDIDSDDDG
ncbi:hypothetical protein ACQP1K_23700 [Sphaerimonospora sp. CA-214678]|uniref:hypothetical protein n=1 Tax=Sphaerimonospora sp. CA-214678 TaxID=3240029 RepID=UPI003D91C388